VICEVFFDQAFVAQGVGLFSRWQIANKAFENRWSGPAKKCFLSLSRPKRIEVMCCQTMEVEALVENLVVKRRPYTAG